MKTTNAKAAAIKIIPAIAVVLLLTVCMQSCGNKEGNVCRECIVYHNGQSQSVQACSSAEEQSLQTEYGSSNVHCY